MSVLSESEGYGRTNAALSTSVDVSARAQDTLVEVTAAIMKDVKLSNPRQDAIKYAQVFLKPSPMTWQPLLDALNAARVHVVQRNRITVGALIGSGYTMRVHRGSFDGRQVALKFLNVDLPYDTLELQHQNEDFKRKVAGAMLEIRVMTHELLRNHNSIVSLLAVSFEVNRKGTGAEWITPILVVELAEMRNESPMTLEDLLSQANRPLSWSERVALMLDISRGLAALHSVGIVHCDMKPANVLLFQDQKLGRRVAKLSDYGFCWVSGDQGLLSGQTRYWAAPEQLSKAPETLKQFRNDPKQDIYSFALVLWFMMFDEKPFGDETKADAAHVTALKLQSHMKEHIQETFARHFHLGIDSEAKRKRRPDHSEPEHASAQYWQAEFPDELQEMFDLGHIHEFQWDKYSQGWLEVLSNHHHCVRYYLEDWLVLNPRHRTLDLLSFENFLVSDRFCQAMKHIYVVPGLWDSLWEVMHDPEHKEELMEVIRHVEDNVPAEELEENMKSQFGFHLSNRWRARVVAPVDAYQIKEPNDLIHVEVDSIPLALQKSIFEQNLAAAQDQRLPVPERARSMRFVAVCYERGFGVERDPRENRRWIREAAELGDHVALFSITMHYQQDGWPDDFSASQRCEWMLTSLLLEEHFSRQDELRTALLTAHEDQLEDPLRNAIADFQVHLKLAVFSPSPSYGLEASSSARWKEAVAAIRNDDRSKLERLLKADQSLLTARSGRATLLHIAAAWGKAGLVRLLLEDYRMDPTALDKDGNTPLLIAARLARSEVVITLQQTAIPQRLKYSIPTVAKLCLLNAILGRGHKTRSLLEVFFSGSMADTSERSRSNQYLKDACLIVSILSNNWSTFVAYLEGGANPSSSVLPIASVSTAEFFEMLIDPEPLYHLDGYTALHVASWRLKPVMVASLLSAGANAAVSGYHGRTPLHLACTAFRQTPAASHWTAGLGIQLAWATVGSLDTADKNAQEKARLIIVDMLVRAGADLLAVDENGNTALEYAISEGLVSTAQYLASKTVQHQKLSDTPLRAARRSSVPSEVDVGVDSLVSILSTSTNGSSMNSEAAHPNFLRTGGVIYVPRTEDPADQDAAHQLEIIKAVHAVSGSAERLDPLHMAALNGNAAIVRYLLKLGTDVNIRTPSSWTSLHLAASRGHVSAVEALLEAHADVCLPMTDGQTALHIAAANGQFHAAKLLAEHGAEMIAQTLSKKLTPVQVAVSEDKYETLELLLGYPQDLEIKEFRGMTALHLAASLDDARFAGALLKAGAQVDARMTGGNETPLMLAAWRGRTSNLKLLLEHHADLEAVETAGRTALQHAVHRDEAAAVQFLIGARANADHKDSAGNTAIYYAVEEHHSGVARMLLESNVDIHTTFSNGATVLHIAAARNMVDVVQMLIGLLLSQGLDIDVADAKGDSALRYAVVNDHADTVQMLLDCGADVNRRNLSGQTALSEAIKCGRVAVMAVLLDASPDFHGIDLDAIKPYPGVDEEVFEACKVLFETKGIIEAD